MEKRAEKAAAPSGELTTSHKMMTRSQTRATSSKTGRRNKKLAQEKRADKAVAPSDDSATSHEMMTRTKNPAASLNTGRRNRKPAQEKRADKAVAPSDDPTTSQKMMARTQNPATSLNTGRKDRKLAQGDESPSSKRSRIHSSDTIDSSSASQAVSISTSTAASHTEHASASCQGAEKAVALSDDPTTSSYGQNLATSSNMSRTVAQDETTANKSDGGATQKTITQNFGEVNANQFYGNVGQIVTYVTNFNNKSDGPPAAELKKIDRVSTGNTEVPQSRRQDRERRRDSREKSSSSSAEEYESGSGHAGDAATIKSILNSTTEKAASSFKMEDLQTPTIRVEPDTYEVAFYKTAVPELEYKPELGFIQEMQKQEGRRILTKDFFDEAADGRRVRTVAVTGGAGFGKTEMLKRFAVDVINKKIPLLQEVEAVHHLNFRDLSMKSNITPGKLLFGKTHLAELDLVDTCVDWVLANQSKFLLVIDGADQYPDTNNDLGKEGPQELHKLEADTTAIINNILSGNLFPDIRILYSSREHTLRHFQNGVRPNRVVALAGFQYDSIKALVQGFAGRHGEAVWDHLSNKSPELLSACSIPANLIFTVSVLLGHLENPPETVTEVLMHILNDLIQSEHIRIKEKIFHVFHGLKAMSFRSTKAGKVTFTKSDLPDDIEEKDYRDLIIPLLGTEGRNQRLFDGNYRYVFFHQSLQEALSALYLAEIKYSDFEKFVAEGLHTPHWVVIRRLLCGVLLNKSTFNVAKRIDPSASLLKTHADEVKQQCLRQSLKQQIQQQQQEQQMLSLEQQIQQPQQHQQTQRDFLELLHAIHECGDDDIASSMKQISVQDLPLTQSDMHVITSIVSRCSQLEKLELPRLNLQQLHTLASTLKTSSCQIHQLYIRTIDLRQATLTQSDVDAVAMILRRCSLIINPILPTLDSTHLRTFASAMKDSQVEILYLYIGDEDNKVRLKREDALAICDMMHGIKEVLDLNYKLDDEEVKLIQDRLNDLPVQVILGITYFNKNGQRRAIRPQ